MYSFFLANRTNNFLECRTKSFTKVLFPQSSQSTETLHYVVLTPFNEINTNGEKISKNPNVFYFMLCIHGITTSL